MFFEFINATLPAREESLMIGWTFEARTIEILRCNLPSQNQQLAPVPVRGPIQSPDGAKHLDPAQFPPQHHVAASPDCFVRFAEVFHQQSQPRLIATEVGLQE